MKNFVFHNPTKLVFGKGMISRLSKEIPAGKKIMITFGSGSAKENGVYDQVAEALDGFDFIEFWGIEPNPKIETLRRAVSEGKKNGVDFLLSVGGGSVLDGTKLIAAALKYDGDAWDLVKNATLIKEVLPFASVMTLPATGSEMNANAVISNGATKEKYGMQVAFPLFSVLDPETTFSLPRYQIANGLADTFVHVMEQYMTTAGQSSLMDRWAEGILLTLIETAPKIVKDSRNYDDMAGFMLSATMGLNGFISMGVSQDWATHDIGHELTALHGITHGETLAIVLPALLTVMKRQKMSKLIQYGERVWNIQDGSDEERADKAIEATERFFRSLGLRTRLHEVNIGDDTIEEIERRFDERGTKLGENKNIDSKVTRQILEKAK